jgi:ribonuclease E
MVKRILVDAAYPQETRVVLLNDDNIEEIEYETYNKQQIKGNIYLAKIVRVEPSLQAAFIDYGEERNGFLPFSEIHPVYYHIPLSDRDKISAELQSINRPEITSDDIASQESNRVKVSDEQLLSLDGEPDYMESDNIDEDSHIDDESEESAEERPQPKEKLYGKYKIQDVIKKGQIILVQAQKEARGNKGASFTSYISLAGKYCVLIPNSEGNNGVSRKIANVEERRRLKNIVDDMMQDPKSSVILRTAAVKRTSYEIKRDYDYLVRLWNKIREVTLQSTAPAFIHMEEDIIYKTIRDMYDHNTKEVLVHGNYAFNCAHEIMHNMLPNEVDKVLEYKSKTPIFTKYNVEELLSNLYQPITELSSGGYIVINPTEALIAIDVNSGRATSERNIEETAYRTNLEAAKEIARQLKLRDLSGLIVVDFIDMAESKNRKSVERVFKDALSRDRARIQMGNISVFGLLEMSRQRLRGSFLEVNTKRCDHCSGKGIVRADESNAMLMLRTIEQEIYSSKFDVVNLYAHTSSVLYLLNSKRRQIKLIEEKYNITLNLLSDPHATADSFSIETIIKSEEHENKTQEKKPLLASTVSLFDNNEELPKVSSSASNKNRTKKWKNKKSGDAEKSPARSEAIDSDKQSSIDHTSRESTQREYIAPEPRENNDVQASSSQEVAEKPRREYRGRRGGHKHEKKEDAVNTVSSPVPAPTEETVRESSSTESAAKPNKRRQYKRRPAEKKVENKE